MRPVEPSTMRNAFGIPQAFPIPDSGIRHSAIRIPHSRFRHSAFQHWSFRIRHSAFRIRHSRFRHSASTSHYEYHRSVWLLFVIYNHWKHCVIWHIMSFYRIGLIVLGMYRQARCPIYRVWAIRCTCNCWLVFQMTVVANKQLGIPRT